MKNALRLTSLTIFTLSWPTMASAQDDAFPLQGLIVTASPTPRAAEAVASNVTIITAADLRRQGDRGLSEVLRDVPGVDVARNGSFGAVSSVFMRGGESDYTLVLVDGIQVNQAGGGFDFASLTTDNIERIEIVRGPASALYGSDAVAGVIHIVTRTGRGPAHGSVSMRAGSYGRWDWSGDVVAGTDRAGYAVAVSRRSTDGLVALNNGSVSTVVSGRARLMADDFTEVAVTFRTTDREYHFPTDGSGALVDENSFTFNDAMTLGLSLRRALTDELSVEAIVGTSEFDGGTDDAQDGPADTLGFYGFVSLDHFRRTSGEVRAHLDLGRAMLTGGFEAEQESQRSFTESESQFGPSSGQSANERDNLGAFVHASGTAGPISYNLGGRLEDNERFGRLATWQAGISVLASHRSATRVRASVGRAIKEPTFFENFATGFALGNPGLDPERSLSWEVGLEQPFWDGRLNARATYFDQTFEDLIQYTSAAPAAGDPNYFNVAAADSRGVELELSSMLGPVTGSLSRTWLDTEVTDPGFDAGLSATFVDGEALLRRPESTYAVQLSAELGPGARMFSRVRVVGTRSDRDFSTFPAAPVELPAYEIWSVGGAWEVGGAAWVGAPSLTLTLHAENLLDHAYEEVWGFAAPGRAVYVGARVGVGGGG